jgi:choline dehydrogenase-like flavoprotein
VQTEVAMLQLPSHAPLRGEKTPDKQYGFHDCSINSGWDIPGEPYTNANRSGASSKWWRQRMMGGRTNHWGRISLRNGPYDFKPRTRFGGGFDWPIGYDDVAPYYDKVEMLVGVFGTNEGLENSPDSSPGVLLPAPKLRVGELYAQKHGKKVGCAHHIDPSRGADEAAGCGRDSRKAASGQCEGAEDPGRQHAHACAVLLGDGLSSRLCDPGELRFANRASAPCAGDGESRHPAERDGARGDDRQRGKATGVTFIDKTTGREGHAKGRVVVLAASSQESVRLLVELEVEDSFRKASRTPAARWANTSRIRVQQPQRAHSGV